MIIGLDVGGTHTDVVLLNDQKIIREVKVVTDTSRLFNTVLTGLKQITRNIDTQQIHRLVLSTTLTTNAIVQNKLPPVGMIVAGGPGIDPSAFKTDGHFFIVEGAMDHRGREVVPVNPKQIRSVADRLKSHGVGHVGVVGKFSIRNPGHELHLRDILKDSFEAIFMGHRISGHLNFPRRIATTYLNAAVYPLHRQFYEAVLESLAQMGLTAPIRVLKADGGNMSIEASIRHPSQTILSGPAASVMGALALAPQEHPCLVLDIGGTTTDMAVLMEGSPILEPVGIRLGGYQTLIRSLKTHSLGIGGDSRVEIQNQRLTIGPERKGPAMAFGGPAPTPTDAIHVLGQSNEGDGEKARQGLDPLAAALGHSVEETAEQILDQACRLILEGAESFIARINRKPVYTVHEVLEGRKVAPSHAVVLGGPAPHFAQRLQHLSGYEVQVVPRWKVANAIGAALARATSEVTLNVDTEQRIANAPAEGFQKGVSGAFRMEDAMDLAMTLLKEKAIKRGADPRHLDLEVVEALSFNMVKGFRTTGKNIRVKVQIRPGLIADYAL